MRSGEIYHYTIYHTTFYAKCQYVVYLIAIIHKIWYDENGELYGFIVKNTQNVCKNVGFKHKKLCKNDNI